MQTKTVTLPVDITSDVDKMIKQLQEHHEKLLKAGATRVDVDLYADGDEYVFNVVGYSIPLTRWELDKIREDEKKRIEANIQRKREQYEELKKIFG